MPDPLTPRVYYESTVAPTPIDVVESGGNINLGKRDTTGLQEAFIGGVGHTNTEQLAAYNQAMANLDGVRDIGQNPAFPQYRKNFLPDPSFGEEYALPRDKVMTEEEVAAAKLGTPYTPTVASPGEGNGVNPETLRSVKGAPSQVMVSGPTDLDNPSRAEHMNTDKDGQTANTGTVRRFKLGVGSGGINEARGQFPRPPQ